MRTWVAVAGGIVVAGGLFGGCFSFTASVVASADSGASPLGIDDAARSADAAQASILPCDAANVYCDSFERAAFYPSAWSLPNRVAGGDVGIVRLDGDAGSAAGFWFSQRDATGDPDGQSPSSVADVNLQKTATQVQFLGRFRLDGIPLNASVTPLTIEQRGVAPFGQSDGGTAPATSYLSVSVSSNHRAQLVQYRDGTTEPKVSAREIEWPSSEWVDLQLVVDSRKKLATLRLGAAQPIELELFESGSDTFAVFGIVQFDPNTHEPFSILVDDVHLEMTP
jgi:hypothetical protein